MPIPGVDIVGKDAAPPRSTPANVATMYMIGVAEKGVVGTIAAATGYVSSMAQYLTKWGARNSTTSVVYDAAEEFFREGGSQLFLSRILGPAAAKASKTLLDASSGTVGTLRAKSEGAWGNTLTIQVTGTGYPVQFIIRNSADSSVLETSPPLADKPSIISWVGTMSGQVDWVDGASTLAPAVLAATAFTGGNDDTASITNTQRQAAADLLTRDLGSGQLTAPGIVDLPMQTYLANVALLTNRIFFPDATDTPTLATITAQGAALRAALTKDQRRRTAGIFGPWTQAPGVTPGTTRIISPSAFIAGVTAEHDGQSMNPNDPAAGVSGNSAFLIGLNPITGLNDTTRTAGNLSGVNFIVQKGGTIRPYGWRTLADPSTDPLGVWLGNARLDMAITAEAEQIAENYLFQQVDGKGITLTKFQGELIGMLTRYYNKGALFGETANDAFNVNVGPQVNTPATLANNEIRATLSVRMSPGAEHVYIEIVRTPITQPVA